MCKKRCSFWLMANKLLNCRLSFVLTIIESTIKFITFFGSGALGRLNIRVETFLLFVQTRQKKRSLKLAGYILRIRLSALFRFYDNLQLHDRPGGREGKVVIFTMIVIAWSGFNPHPGYVVASLHKTLYNGYFCFDGSEQTAKSVNKNSKKSTIESLETHNQVWIVQTRTIL